MESYPRVSVVIPAYNRPDSLRRTLDTLSQQTYPADRYEVVVVDDGSEKDLSPVTREDYPFQLRYVRQANQGDAVARNTGAETAEGDYLLFVDDDIALDEACLEAFVDALQSHPRGVIVGNLKTVFPDPPDPFHRHLERAFPRRAQENDGRIGFLECKSGFMAIQRGDYFVIGMMQGLNERGANAWCDVDFGYRAHKDGYEFYRSPEAIGYHHDGALQDVWTFYERSRKTGQLGAKLFAKHPELRGEIHTFLDKEPISLVDDSLSMIVRKAFRAITAQPPVIWLMRQQIRALEHLAPSSSVLPLLYRWTMSSYIYRGYREGLNEYDPIETDLGNNRGNLE